MRGVCPNGRCRLPTGAEPPARECPGARSGPALQQRCPATFRTWRADDACRRHNMLVRKRTGVDVQREKREVQFRVPRRGGSGQLGRFERPHVGGLRRNADSVNKVPSLTIAGALSWPTVEGFIERHPKAGQRCILAIGSGDEGVGPGQKEMRQFPMVLREALPSVRVLRSAQ